MPILIPMGDGGASTAAAISATLGSMYERDRERKAEAQQQRDTMDYRALLGRQAVDYENRRLEAEADAWRASPGFEPGNPTHEAIYQAAKYLHVDPRHPNAASIIPSVMKKFAEVDKTKAQTGKAEADTEQSKAKTNYIEGAKTDATNAQAGLAAARTSAIPITLAQRDTSLALQADNIGSLKDYRTTANQIRQQATDQTGAFQTGRLANMQDNTSLAFDRLDEYKRHNQQTEATKAKTGDAFARNAQAPIKAQEALVGTLEKQIAVARSDPTQASRLPGLRTRYQSELNKLSAMVENLQARVGGEALARVVPGNPPAPQMPQVPGLATMTPAAPQVNPLDHQQRPDGSIAVPLGTGRTMAIRLDDYLGRVAALKQANPNITREQVKAAIAEQLARENP